MTASISHGPHAASNDGQGPGDNRDTDVGGHVGRHDGQSLSPEPRSGRSGGSIGRRTYSAGSVAFLCIGAAHTLTQFTTLSTELVKAQLRMGGDIHVNGEIVDAWHLFAGTSLLMGLFSIAIGLLNLAALRAIGRPDPLVCLVNIATVAGVGLVGAVRLSWLQLYGGALGIVLFGVPVAERIRSVGRRPGAVATS